MGQAAPAILAAAVTTLLVVAAWLLGERSVIVVILASCVGSAAGLLFAVMSIRSSIKPVRTSMSVLRLMARYSAKLYIGSAADFLHFRQDVLMLGWMAGLSSVGVYSVGVSFAEIATRLPAAMGSAIQAQASRVSHESALDLASRAIRLTALFAIAVVVFLGVVVSWLIPWLFGPGFAGSVTVFYLLAPGIIANALIWPISSYQSARGTVYWRESVSCVALNVGLNLVLIPLWGYLGAAVASSVSYALLAGLLLWRLCGDSGLGPGSFLLTRSEDLRIVVASARSYMRRR